MSVIVEGILNEEAFKKHAVSTMFSSYEEYVLETDKVHRDWQRELDKAYMEYLDNRDWEETFEDFLEESDWEEPSYPDHDDDGECICKGRCTCEDDLPF